MEHFPLIKSNSGKNKNIYPDISYEFSFLTDRYFVLSLFGEFNATLRQHLQAYNSDFLYSGHQRQITCSLFSGINRESAKYLNRLYCCKWLIDFANLFFSSFTKPKSARMENKSV